MSCNQKIDRTAGSWSIQAVHALLASRMPTKGARVYEAGGGSASSLPSKILSSARVTVVDIAEDQLQRNAYAETKILGDIQAQEFPEGTFDLVVCFNVIEHLELPDRAIKNFYQALGPGGLLFIAAPNPASLSGWVTRFSPHWFHVLYYRKVLGYKDAGLPGRHPFPTVFHRVVNPTALIEFSQNLGFKVLYRKVYRGMVYENLSQRKPALGRLLNLSVQAANALTLWRKDLRNGDYHIVLEKPAGGSVVGHQ